MYTRVYRKLNIAAETEVHNKFFIRLAVLLLGYLAIRFMCDTANHTVASKFSTIFKKYIYTHTHLETTYGCFCFFPYNITSPIIFTLVPKSFLRSLISDPETLWALPAECLYLSKPSVSTGILTCISLQDLTLPFLPHGVWQSCHTKPTEALSHHSFGASSLTQMETDGGFWVLIQR